MAKRRLNEKQIAAIELLADFGQHLTYEEIAKRVGVDVSTLRRWRTKDQAFIDELIAQCKRNAVKDLPRVMEAVPDIIIKSENAAMLRTWLQTIGALTEKVEVTNKSDTSNADLMEKEESNAVPRVSPEEKKAFVLEYIKNAYDQGRKYSEINRDKTKYGVLQNLVNYHFDNILTACDVAGISPEGFVNDRTIVKNIAENLTKQDVDNYIKQRHKGLNRGLTEREFKTDYYSKAVFNKAVNIYGSFALALRANSIRPSINTTNTLSDLKEGVISLFNNGVSGRKIEEMLGISATSVYKILRESGIKPSEYLDKLSCNTASVTVGYMFEELLGEILTELGVDFKKYAHERWKPDFVVGNTWIDAKLTYRSGIFKTYEKYKECCEKVVFVYLIGPIEIKKFSDDYIKLSVYKLVENVKDVKIRSKFISKLNKLYQIALNSDERFVSPGQDKRNERIIELANSGLSFHKIAAELGISLSTVSHVCSMYGVKSKAKRGRPKVKEVI